ncbi:class I SAM-dependent methyltransferase [Accumulibacter sp.]|jgi:SAM-dependent methyltransferase|uniref:class I SAM-dependent methyltransferase n=1 Tax=Accumulibacter sp. TaxID=2053492 RepID=UPI002631690E|nr:class I SAM-dependent methyltransferase [Accumulibacter sp.]
MLLDKENAMNSESRPRTAGINARPWGARARDWADIQEGGCRPVYLAVFERVGLRSGAAYLDVGCGAGMASQIAAERGARVSGLDAAGNLLAIARERVPDGELHVGELESLPFADHSFDLVTGFNSFQFAGNPGVALAEARRVAKPGAYVVIVTWGRPEGMEAASLLAALRPLLPPPPPGAPGPFALSDENALRAFATAAGLDPAEVFDVDSPWQYPDLAVALRGLRSSGVAARAIESHGEEVVDSAHSRALLPFRQANGSYTIGARFRCLLARA